MNNIEQLLNLSSTFIGCVSISVFTSLVGISVGIASCAVGLKVWVITTGIKKYNLIIKKKRKNMMK